MGGTCHVAHVEVRGHGPDIYGLELIGIYNVDTSVLVILPVHTQVKPSCSTHM